jgi:signal peptidase I
VPESEQAFLENFPTIVPAPTDTQGAVQTWAVELPSHLLNGELVVPPGKYFMMGDHRHGSMDSRFWGFVPRENVMGRPLFNYWSFKTPDHQQEETGVANTVGWMAHVVSHFFTDTRRTRMLHRVR